MKVIMSIALWFVLCGFASLDYSGSRTMTLAASESTHGPEVNYKGIEEMIKARAQIEFVRCIKECNQDSRHERAMCVRDCRILYEGCKD